MKKLLVALIGLVCLATANAQEFDTTSSANLGIRASFDLNSPSTNMEDYGTGSGFSFGALYNIPLTANIYFEPGLSFFYNTMSINNHIIDPMHHIQGTLQNCGFRMPLAFGYRFYFTPEVSVAAFTGPQLNYGLKLEMKCGVLESGSLYGNGFGHFDAQWLFGVRFHYQDNWFAEIGGGVGIGNLLTGNKSKESHLRRNTFSIGVGYLF